jgi:hypothetical protein
MFKENLDFENAIIHYYGKKKFIVLKQIISKAQVLAIAEAITSILNHVVFACVMNQSRGHWLLLDALTLTITFIMEMEAQLLELSVEVEIYFFAQEYVAIGNKGNQTFFGVSKFFLCEASSQHDGFHVGSPFQGIACSGKLGGT